MSRANHRLIFTLKQEQINLMHFTTARRLFSYYFFYLYIKKTWYKQCLYVCKCKLLLLLLPCFVPFTECSSPHRPGLRYQDKCQVDFKKVRAEHISDSQLLNLFSARIHQKSVRQPDLDTVQLMPASQIRLRISLKGPTCSLWRWFVSPSQMMCSDLGREIKNTNMIFCFFKQHLCCF